MNPHVDALDPALQLYRACADTGQAIDIRGIERRNDAADTADRFVYDPTVTKDELTRRCGVGGHERGRHSQSAVGDCCELKRLRQVRSAGRRTIDDDRIEE